MAMAENDWTHQTGLTNTSKVIIYTLRHIVSVMSGDSRS